MDAIQEFRATMIADGLNPPTNIEPDKVHRFPGIGKPNGDDGGRCKLFGDLQGGWYMDFASGLKGFWQAKRNRPQTAAEREAFKAKCEADRKAREEEEARQHAEAAKVAQSILDAATGDPTQHPYAVKKAVPLGPLVKRGRWPQRGWDDAILIKVLGASGRLFSVEAISPEGRKDFLKGGRTNGGFHPLGKIRDATVVLIGESLSSIAPAHNITEYPAAAAMSRGNLKHVAIVVRRLAAPGAVLIFLADNDIREDGTNFGLEDAKAAAEAVGGVVAVPELDGRKCDFWDLWHERGAEAVREALKKATGSAGDDGSEQDEPTGTAPKEGAEQSDSDRSADYRDWPEPQPLPEGLPPVAQFDFALLPDTLRPWAEDICERFQCAPDFVAVAIMTAMGSVSGRKVGIRPQLQTDWIEIPNIWGLIIGRPAVMKSPSIEAGLGGLKRLVARALEEHKSEMEEFRRMQKLAELKASAAERAAKKGLGKVSDAELLHQLDIDEPPEQPTLRRYIVNDSTAAALGELHRLNPNGLLVHRDEMVSLLKSLDREDNAEARGFYLTGWNGNSPYTFDRITRGMNLHIPAVCLSLLGSTQPGRIAEYIRQAVRGGSGDDGLIQRFGLLVWPDIGGDWRDVDRLPDNNAKREAFRVFDYLDAFNPIDIGAQQDIDYRGDPEGVPYLRFIEGGLELFQKWRAVLEVRLRGGELHPAMESHLAKYRKLVPGLALILHLANGGKGPVSEHATLQALAWAEYLETHAHRAYASVTMPEVSAAKAIIQKIRQGNLPQIFSSRDVWRPGWATLSDRELVADALRLLVDLDWLFVSKLETKGRTATVYRVNPKGVES